MSLEPLFGFLAGILSCLTPEALTLVPLLLGATAVPGRIAAVMTALGLGVALIATGAIAVSLSANWGFGASGGRWTACLILLVWGSMLLRQLTVDRLAVLTGGSGDPFGREVPLWPGPEMRQFLLAAIVGAAWVPRLGPVLGKASLMAADGENARLALAILFVFGMGAAVPWLVAGRVLRLAIQPIAGGILTGMASKRILGLALLTVAIVGFTGQDLVLAHLIDGVTPAVIRDLATRY